MRFLGFAALVLALGCAFPLPARAQSAWLEREPRASVFLEVLHPDLDRGTKFPTWAWFLTARVPVREHTALVVELPYARGEVADFYFGTLSSAAVGNPYIGVSRVPRPSGVHLEAGIRLPLASDDVGVGETVGFLSDIEREEAFVPDQLTARVGVHFVSVADEKSSFAYDLRFAPAIWIKTGDDGLSDSETFLGYGLTIRNVHRDARIGFGFTGRWNLSSGTANFDASTVHEFDAAADFLHGRVRPGLQFKAPLDSGLGEVLDVVWGATVTVLP